MLRAPRTNRHKARTGLFVASILVLSLAVGCVTVDIPVDEYNLARAAIESARESDSPRFTPGLWYKAEAAYKEAQRLFSDRQYRQARRFFDQARFLAEKAENAARLARFQSGDTVP